MSSPAIPPELEAELAAVAEQAGCELAHAEFKGGVLRLFIDREGGVTLADCETVSRQVSPLLDVAGFSAGRYTLEVSSPGLDRGLWKPRDFERFVGRRARVTFRSPDTGRKRTVVGRLTGFDAAVPAVEIEEAERGERLRLALAEIEAARLEVEI